MWYKFLWFSEKSFINSSVNEKSEWLENNSAIFFIAWYIRETWKIVQWNSLQIQIQLEFMGDFQWEICCKFTSHHNISIQFNDFSLAYICMHANSVFPHKNWNEHLWSDTLCFHWLFNQLCRMDAQDVNKKRNTFQNTVDKRNQR